MAWFKRKGGASEQRWEWDPAAAGLTGDQAWSLLTNAIYFKAVAPRLDALGGGLGGLNWAEGLAQWWDVNNEREFDELTEWMISDGFRATWAAEGVDGGDDKFAWDYCRLITVSGGAALAGVIDEDRAWSLTLQAGEGLANRFDSWEALSRNYLSGRILWLKDKGQWSPVDDPGQQQFQGVADALLVDESSPWNRVDWDRSGGMVVDGSLFG